MQIEQTVEEVAESMRDYPQEWAKTYMELRAEYERLRAEYERLRADYTSLLAEISCTNTDLH